MLFVHVGALMLLSTAPPPPRAAPHRGLHAPRVAPLQCSAADGPRALGRRAAVAQLALLAAAPTAVRPAQAADSSERRWVSGRSDPIRKTNSKEKADGTKKDPKYLSCLNDCVPRCLGPPGSEAKERGDCTRECQDECCFTYEQCTYTIRL